jgi:hypothetical protein
MGAERSAQPDVEEIRQVGVADVVVVRRVGGDDFVGADGLRFGIVSLTRQSLCRWQEALQWPLTPFDVVKRPVAAGSENGLPSAKSQVMGIACRPKVLRRASILGLLSQEQMLEPRSRSADCKGQINPDTASAYAVAPVPPASRPRPSSGMPACKASARMRARGPRAPGRRTWSARPAGGG